MYDVVIIGGGPAGATLARMIGLKYRVLIIERRDLKNQLSAAGFVKCCGGLLAPDAQKMLSIMNLGVPADTLMGPQIFSVRTFDFDNGLEKYYQRHYINIDREKFDRWLISLVPDSVQIETGTMFKTVTDFGEHYSVSYSQKGKQKTVKTKMIVGADGAFSRVRRQLFPYTDPPVQYISIQEWYRSKEKMSSFCAIFDKEITDFYSWIIPEGDFFLLGTAVRPGKNAVDKFSLLKQKLTAKGLVFSDPVKKSGAFLLRPSRNRQLFTGRNNVFLIGEAAGFISPSSAEGISYAFRSAIALADAMNMEKCDISQMYKKNTRALKFNIFVKHLKSPFMYNRIFRKLILKSGLMSIRPLEK